MTHRQARRRLSALLDGPGGGLDVATRGRVQAHARACARCRRALRELEAVETLVRLLPPSLLPYEPSCAADARLWGLARWFVDPLAAWRERRNLGAVGVGVALMAFALSLAVATWTPTSAEANALIQLAQAAPDASAMLPLGWR